MTDQATRVQCSACEGSGCISDDEGWPVTCTTCDGAGVVFLPPAPPATNAEARR